MRKRKKIVFIINPKAGRKKNQVLKKKIEKKLDTKKYKPEFLYTQYPGHAVVLVKEYFEKGVQIFIAVGGDGTVNEVASEVVKLKATLGILPTGSGNGLARFLNIPFKVQNVIEIINNGKVCEIDVGKINDDYFFCTCGIGFDAEVSYLFAKQKSRGFINYIKTSVKAYTKYKPAKIKLKIDGIKYKKKAFLITIANAGQYGNNAYIAPSAKIDDGKFDVCILKPFPWYISPILVIKLFLRIIDRSKQIETIKAKSIVFRNEKKKIFHIDGDPRKIKGKVKLDIMPKSLKVLVK